MFPPTFAFMRIVITAATANELSRINSAINPLYTSNDLHFHVLFHKSGVGILASAFALDKLIADVKPNLIIQAGIAGSFDVTSKLGTVVVAKDEYLGDIGVEENGQFQDVFDLNLENENEFPFQNKRLTNPWLEKFNVLELKEVTSVTVNEVTTRTERIQQLQEKYEAVIESMEGAALHYVCLATKTPFIQIRAISNYIGERDKTKWMINEALNNLQVTILKYLDKLYDEATRNY